MNPFPTLLSFPAARRPVTAAALIFAWVSAPFAAGHGEVGEHVQALRKHLPAYAESVEVFLAEVDEVVSAYESGGAAATDANRLIEAWENAKIHAAIERNYAPLYAGIWQGIYGIKDGVENTADPSDVRATRESLERTLWQSLGAVKMAAAVQEERDAAGKTGVPEDAPLGGAAAIREIEKRLDRIVAKSAERDFATAKEMTHDTYLTLFEGVEDELKTHDQALVSAIEKDFNVTLPLLLEKGAPLETIREAAAALKTKLERAGAFLTDEE
jgi:hypothetical protein